MTSDLARDIAHVCAAECIEPIQHVLTSENFTGWRRSLVEKVRDRLHDACRAFEHDTCAEDFESHYLPLFDALSLVTDALTVRALLYDRLRLGLSVLKRIRQEGGSR